MQPGEILWTPGPERVRQANVTAFTDWLARERGRRFADYNALWRWSVEDLEGFWQALWDYFGIAVLGPAHAGAGPARHARGRVVPGRAPELRAARAAARGAPAARRCFM